MSLARRLELAVALSLAIAGCGLLGVGEEPPDLGVSNGTTLDVTIVVNGRAVAVVAPGGPSPEIDENALPLLPWTVEARTATGRVLLSIVVNAGSVSRTTHPDGGSESRGVAARVDLSCGRLDLYAGPPLLGPPPPENPGKPGDCVP